MPEEFLVAGRRIDTKIMTAQKFGFELLSVVKPTKTLFQKNNFFATLGGASAAWYRAGGPMGEGGERAKDLSQKKYKKYLIALVLYMTLNHLTP